MFESHAKRADDEEPGFKFDRHQFALREYVSITEHDRVLRTVRVIWLRDL